MATATVPFSLQHSRSLLSEESYLKNLYFLQRGEDESPQDIVLDLKRNASKKEIKEAFRRLALEFHPDKHSQSSTAVRNAAAIKFKQISEAYQFLMDENKRFYYDRVRSQSNASSSTYGYVYGFHNNNHRQTYRQATSGGLLSKLGIAFRLHTQGDPLLIGCGMLACPWLGGIIMFDAKEKKQKSVEEIKESLEKSKASIKKAKSHKDEN